MNKLFNINLYFPMICYDNSSVEYNQQRKLNELEAIIFSFIYINHQQNKHSSFLDLLYKTFNLDKQKWNDYFIDLLKQLIDSKQVELLKSNISYEDLFCGDLKLHKEIETKLSQFDFCGFETKPITKNIPLEKPYFGTFKSLINNKYTQLSIDDFNCVNELIKSVNITDVEQLLYDKALELIDQKHIITKLNIIPKDFKIKFIIINQSIKLNLENNQLIISSNNKTTDELLQTYNKYNFDELIIKSINDSLNKLTNNLITNLDEASNNFQFLDFNQYESINQLIQTFSNDFNLNHYFVDENNQINKLSYYPIKYIIIIDKPSNISIPINLMTYTKVDNLFDFIYKQLTRLIKEDNFSDSLSNSLIKYINKLTNNQKTSINELLFNNFLQISNNQAYIDYCLTNVFVNNINDKIVKFFLLLTNINHHQLEKLINQNINYFNSNHNLVFYLNNKDISDEKIETFINLLKIDVLKYHKNDFINNQYIQELFNIKQELLDIINIQNDDKEYNDLQLDNILKSIENKINKFPNWIKSLFNDLTNQAKAKIQLVYQNNATYIIKQMNELTSLLEQTILDKKNNSPKDVLNLLNKNNSRLQSTYKEIKDIRNIWSHKTNSDINSFIESLKSKSIYKNQNDFVNKINEYIQWLKDNKDEIINIQKSAKKG